MYTLKTLTEIDINCRLKLSCNNCKKVWGWR